MPDRRKNEFEYNNKPGIRICKICSHPGVEEINAMILNGVRYEDITRRMKQLYPSAPRITQVNITTHKKHHLLNKPVSIESPDGKKYTYIAGATVAEKITIDKSAIPEGVSIPDALKVIISAGVANILQNPETVTPAVLVSALELARKSGLLTAGAEEFVDAWEALANSSKRKSKKRTRRVTVEEEEEVIDAGGDAETVTQGDVIDAQPELPESPQVNWPAGDVSFVPRKDDHND